MTSQILCHYFKGWPDRSYDQLSGTAKGIHRARIRRQMPHLPWRVVAQVLLCFVGDGTPAEDDQQVRLQGSLVRLAEGR